MNKIVATFAGAIALASTAFLPAEALAVGINGSATFGTSGVTINGTNLSDSTLFNFSSFGGGLNSMQVGTTAGDYVTVPSSFGIVVSSTVLDIVNETFSYTTPTGTFGTFSGITSFQVVQQSASFLDVFIIATFTPDAGAGDPLGPPTNLEPTLTSLRISLNQSGESVGATITQNSPPVGIPEPATLALLGAGLVGLGLARRRRSA